LFSNFSGNNFSLQSSSPAAGVGVDLGALFDQYPVPGATWPNPDLGTRSLVSAWDLGAFATSGASGGQPTPPSSLTATVTN
jgi:hypothetical protein